MVTKWSRSGLYSERTDKVKGPPPFSRPAPNDARLTYDVRTLGNRIVAYPKEFSLMAAIDRRDWLLLLFDDSSRPIDRVRIQKTMFLFAERSHAGADQKSTFEPYLYGPFSFHIYPYLGQLVAAEILREEG